MSPADPLLTKKSTRSMSPKRKSKIRRKSRSIASTKTSELPKKSHPSRIKVPKCAVSTETIFNGPNTDFDPHLLCEMDVSPPDLPLTNISSPEIPLPEISLSDLTNCLSPISPLLSPINELPSSSINIIPPAICNHHFTPTTDTPKGTYSVTTPQTSLIEMKSVTRHCDQPPSLSLAVPNEQICKWINPSHSCTVIDNNSRPIIRLSSDGQIISITPFCTILPRIHQATAQL